MTFWFAEQKYIPARGSDTWQSSPSVLDRTQAAAVYQSNAYEHSCSAIKIGALSRSPGITRATYYTHRQPDCQQELEPTPIKLISSQKQTKITVKVPLWKWQQNHFSQNLWILLPKIKVYPRCKGAGLHLRLRTITIFEKISTLIYKISAFLQSNSCISR